ncbi:Glucose-1-phosphate thymidylyltransferase [Hondaea fermentalgiana]|uniref:UTP--glucose-1-phosphate uridylyltransferase n=1 Tax=Hondaea fermentalgiana TaxID=2315210 RepID=A0A2R5GSS1_9STRA|nr:Glucose-1-phosphate thymidylyltransferase [Hondaea fermentalgiana]|eukprot:GBG33890.1 Glucose-1-phosphate thymidylyltransferase [Hondaea fermentalgiana]
MFASPSILTGSVVNFTLLTPGIPTVCIEHPSKVVVTSTDNNGCKTSAEFSMDKDTLLKVAREGGYFSYVAGVAYKILEDHVVGGVQIDNYMTTLPLKKGLSSSAAICVLTTRAFNKLYDLRLTTRGEMEYAYQGELITPSQCGRLDQACAFGSTPVLMTYDGEFTGVQKITVGLELHFVIVDLCAAKSTVAILDGLRSAYPKAVTEEHQKLQDFLGPQNKAIVHEALDLMSADPESHGGPSAVVEKLGALLKRAQAGFDAHGAPLCPSELTAPVLHRCLEHPSLAPYITGGKWVGAGGDGTAQLLCRSAVAQREVARIVKDELHMDPMLLTVSPGSRIQTAVIPAGGFAGSLFPASQACKAELFPIYDARDGMCKPLILGTVEQLLDAGLERVVLVVQADDLRQFQRLFQDPITPSNATRLPDRDEGRLASYARRLIDMGRHVDFVVQEQQQGFGHAVHCAREHVGQAPFLLVLGHHVYLTAHEGGLGRSSVEQMLDAHKMLGTNVVGLKRSAIEEVPQFGTVTGSFRQEVDHVPNRVLTVTSVVEKPSESYARENLHVPGMPPDDFLTMFGMYAIEPAIFDILDDFIRHDLRSEKGDIAFTPALDQLRQASGLAGIVMEAERLPINSPEAFIETNQRLLKIAQDARASSLSQEQA